MRFMTHTMHVATVPACLKSVLRCCIASGRTTVTSQATIACLQAHGRELAESVANVMGDLKAKPLVAACMPLLATQQIAGAAALPPLEPALLQLLHLLCSGKVHVLQQAFQGFACRHSHVPHVICFR